MPIYKIYRSGVQERRNKLALAKWRWAAVAISVALLSMAVLMLLHSQP